MKRILVFPFVIGLSLVVCNVQAAPAPGTPKGKEQYSSRPKNYVPPTLPMVEPTVERQSSMVFETPSMPTPTLRRAPQPPGTAQTTTFPSPTLVLTAPETISANPNKPDPIVITEQSESRPISSVDIDMPAKRTVARPVEDGPKNEETAVLKFTPQKPETKTVEPRTDAKINRPIRPEVRMPEREAEKTEDPVGDLDDFNARLAKIQLEKHNLAETLTLIEKIKSPNFKVKTLVDLAEYVSRDGNYKREADTLYALAVEGIEALAENKPIVVKMPSSPVRTPAKAAVTLIDENEPAKPKTEPVVKVQPKTEPKPVQIAPTVPEPKVVEAAPVVKPELPEINKEPEAVAEPTSPAKPSAPRMPVLLDEPPMKKETAEKVEPEAPVQTPKLESETTAKPGQPTLAPSPIKEAPAVQLEEDKTDTPQEQPSTIPGKRPSIIQIEETKKDTVKVEPKKDEPVRNDSTTAAPEEKAAETLEKAEEPKPAEKPKTSRKRPMPGKRVVTLEEN